MVMFMSCSDFIFCNSWEAVYLFSICTFVLLVEQRIEYSYYSRVYQLVQCDGPDFFKLISTFENVRLR